MATSSTRRDTLVRALRGARPDFTLTNARSFADLVIAAPGDVFKASPLTFVPHAGAPVASSHVQAGRSDQIEALGQIQQKLEAARARISTQAAGRLRAYMQGIGFAANHTTSDGSGPRAVPSGTLRMAIVADRAAAAVAARLAVEIARVEGRVSTERVVEVDQEALLGGRTAAGTAERLERACANAIDGVLLITGIDKRAVALDEILRAAGVWDRFPLVMIAGSRDGLDEFFVAGSTAVAHEFGWPVSSAGASTAETSSPSAVDGIDRARAMIDAASLAEMVKFELHTFMDSARLAEGLRNRGLDDSAAVVSALRHCAFVGDLGTGKTTAARLVAKVLHGVGLLATDTVVAVRRVELVGASEGQTAALVRKAVAAAKGGVLVVDDPNELIGSRDHRALDPFGQEVVAGLVEAMDSGEVLVIFAGRSRGMDAFLAAAPGVVDRVERWVVFPSASAGEIARAAGRIVLERGRSLDRPGLLDGLAELLNTVDGGAILLLRNYWAAQDIAEAAEEFHQERLPRDLSGVSDAELTEIRIEDMEAAIRRTAAGFLPSGSGHRWTVRS
ncbi:AAA family ATPase [Gordonia malaquae]|uniref:AAA family ATPase n=1 Tax=Gordonia malaquae TaxID=410332 RepID=UPI003019CA1C